ncbi:tungstate/molybdate binding protein [Dethiosulfatibacter aminovorans DSM 17477]|uniref:Tungstate/molybdate binding protein n=1 Tax=Dethiosulfatibacter aminovorans DSM 17477 TaxID=1121476 RepID=A0A1M6H0X4_9FIRM|nr:tungstate ABC transporter substrate-binding protein WtpA [Dethiosulfatibacter aminovorans]SHJ15796.1 tungstate/molybdate binding protein [Dethiosulfatibacter aminovorans DSM 17477]
MKKKVLLMLVLVISMVMYVGCSPAETVEEPAEDVEPQEEANADADSEPAAELEGDLVIYHAGSLSVPFGEMEAEFEEMYPNVDVLREPAGSRSCAKKISELGKEAHIMASADYTVIDNLLIPDFADFNVLFAKNEMVIAYSETSQYADEITSENWYEILLRDGVNYGHSDHNADPCGYRSLMVYQLAEDHYGIEGLEAELDAHCPEKNIRPKETDLLAMIETGTLDYFFIYRSVAVQHDLPFVELPEEINLSSVDFTDFYATATVEVAGSEPGQTITQVGKPIVYGVTIPKNTPDEALSVAFINYLLDRDKGLAIMDKNGQPVLDPLVVYGEENLNEGIAIEK